MKIKIPSIEEYKTAFESIKSEINANDLKMLKANYDAPEHTISAEIMSEIMGYATHDGANLRYGTLGSKLCRQLNLNPKFKVEAICNIVKPGVRDNIHWLWIMRSEVVQALKELRWV